MALLRYLSSTMLTLVVNLLALPLRSSVDAEEISGLILVSSCRGLFLRLTLWRNICGWNFFKYVVLSLLLFFFQIPPAYEPGCTVCHV